MSSVQRGSRWTKSIVAFVLLSTGAVSGQDSAWPTYRGDLQRRGCLDGKPVAGKPEVLWALPGKNQYFAAPCFRSAAEADSALGTIFLPALGTFNVPIVQALWTSPAKNARVRWEKSGGVTKLPTAASPVTARGMVLFGEGMHQNVAGAVTAFDAEDGMVLWRIQFDGELRHVEGSPTILGDRAYFGCGSGGVVCIDITKVQLEGKEMSVAQAKEALITKWKTLLAAYEKQKKEDPDFAVPPSEADLPVATPKVVWTSGADEWHVDAPVGVVDGGTLRDSALVLVGSAFLDEEKKGKRAVLCLDAATGKTIWETPVAHNPWGAPSVMGDVVLVGCSSIRYDPAELGHAKGEVVALASENGKPRWRLPVPGGVLSPVAIFAGDGRANPPRGVFTATDGKVRGVDIGSGTVVWTHDGKKPYFAGPVLAGSDAYVVDLDGGVTALTSAKGQRLWGLDLSRDPKVGLPGRVYASPLAAEGRLYFATCNVEGPHAGKPTAVICVGENVQGEKLARGVSVDTKRRRVIVDAKIAPRKLPHLKKIYPIEVMATNPNGKKAHETVLVIEAQPSQVHESLVRLGLEPGRPGIGEERKAEGPEVVLTLEYPGRGGTTKRVNLARTVVDRRTRLPLRNVRWLFTGTVFLQPDPQDERKVFGADAGGTLITIYPVTGETVFQSSLGMEEEALLDLETAKLLPPVGTDVRLVIEPVEALGIGRGK